MILIAFGFAVYYLMKYKSIIGGKNEAPLVTLNKKYAKGELTKEQYEKTKEELK